MSARAGYKRILITLQQRLIAMQEPSADPSEGVECGLYSAATGPLLQERYEALGRSLHSRANGGRGAGFCCFIRFSFYFRFVVLWSLLSLLLVRFFCEYCCSFNSLFCMFLYTHVSCSSCSFPFVFFSYLAKLWCHLLKELIICNFPLLVSINKNNCLHE